MTRTPKCHICKDFAHKNDWTYCETCKPHPGNHAALKKSHSELLKACKASQIFLLDDDLYAQTATLRKTLSDAIKTAESLEVK